MLSNHLEQLSRLRAIIKSELQSRRIEKSNRGRTHCPVCQQWKGMVVRVFPSYEEFAGSPYYGGGDLVINDQHATRAVWPGKDNVSRTANDWWICIPVHPYCGCYWSPWNPPTDEDSDDPFAQWAVRERDESFRAARREQNRNAYISANPERFKSASMLHCQHVALLREAIRHPQIHGFAPNVSDAVHAFAHDEPESWTRVYLRRWRRHNGAPENDTAILRDGS